MNPVSVHRSIVRAPALALLAGLVSLGALGAACSSDNGDLNAAQLQDALAKAGSARTASSVPATGDADPTADSGASPSAIRSSFDSAIAARDFCGVLTELDSVVTDLTDPASVVAAYDQLRDSVAAATSLVPAEISAPWTVLVGATQRAASAAERSDGDPKDKSLEGVFVDPDVDSAIDSIFAFEDRTCRTDGSTTTTTTSLATTTQPTGT